MANRIVSDTLIAKLRYLVEYMDTREGLKETTLLSFVPALFLSLAIYDTAFVFQYDGIYLRIMSILLIMFYAVSIALVLTLVIVVRQLLEFYLTDKYAPQTQHVSQSTTIHEDEGST